MKDFYLFTDGLNPLQVQLTDVEAWNDDMVKRSVVPAYTSPFEIMGEKFQAKLTVIRKDGGTKKAMNLDEIRKLLVWARTTQPIGDYGAMLFLLTSGLRDAELLSLT